MDKLKRRFCLRINQKNEELASENWRGLDDRDDYGGGEEFPWKCKQWNKEAR